MFKIILVTLSFIVITSGYCDIIICTPVNNQEIKNHILKIYNKKTIEIWVNNEISATHKDVCAENKINEEIVCLWHPTRAVTIDTINMFGNLRTYKWDRVLLNCLYEY